MTLLYLDVDRRTPPRLIPFVTECCRRWGWPLRSIRYDRTKHGWHVVVGVRRRVPPALMLAAQAMWGSDPRREMFNLGRVQVLDDMPKFWRDRWNVLYSSHTHNVTVKKSNT